MSTISRPETNPNDFIPRKSVWYENLHPSDDNALTISNMIDRSMIIDNIVEINNSFLAEAYFAKRKEKQRFYGYGGVSEKFLFHGTTKAKLKDICTYNFDWRLFKPHKFGRGVSFAVDSFDASIYSRDDYHKVMIVAKVLIGRIYQPTSRIEFPPYGYDTVLKPEREILVKYEDNEFYPAYKVYFHFDDDSDDEEESFDEEESTDEEESYYTSTSDSDDDY